MSPLLAARPVLKWAGGKSQLVSEILKRLPGSIETYYEPFIGGAAVFFALAAEKRFRKAVLADTNPDLVALYQAIQSDVEGVIQALEVYRDAYDEQAYYRVRDARPPRKAVERAARLIFLNKTGYNGLYRVNRAGQFNVPFGRYKNPRICDPQNLRAAARVLGDAQIHIADFAQISRRARKGDAVYLDPPYLPISKTASFTAYGRQAFALKDHQRLALQFERLAKRGIAALLSNSDTPVTRELFEKFRVETVSATRAINSDAKKRGPVSEILVSTRACAEVRRARGQSDAQRAQRAQRAR
jgi:DNA adenine methylase